MFLRNYIQIYTKYINSNNSHVFYSKIVTKLSPTYRQGSYRFILFFIIYKLRKNNNVCVRFGRYRFMGYLNKFTLSYKEQMNKITRQELLRLRQLFKVYTNNSIYDFKLKSQIRIKINIISKQCYFKFNDFFLMCVFVRNK